jgi:hypothetical protein
VTSFSQATIEDDAELRTILRSNSMAGWVTMSTEREPSFFASLNHFGKEQAVIARREGKPVGMYLCAVQHLHLNGRPSIIGYLGGLRVNPDFRNRLNILRAGYSSARAMQSPDALPFWYTSIASDNTSARRLLEANLKGMPSYAPVGEMLTMALPRARGQRMNLWREALPSELDTVCEFYNRHASEFQFSPVLSADAACRTGAKFYVHSRKGEIVASMALWNQQAYKQVVARGYRQPLKALLPVYNSYARLARRVSLPPINQALDQTLLAFFSTSSSDGTDVVDLVRDALAICPTKVLTLGLHAEHPWIGRLQRTFRPAVYRTNVYLVHYDRRPELDRRPIQPEVAVL